MNKINQLYFDSGKFFNNNKIYFLITYLIYASGGIMFFYLKPLPKILTFGFFLLVFLWERRKVTELGIFLVLILYTIIFLVQKITLPFYDLSNYMSYIIIILNAYLGLKILGDKFYLYYIKLVYYFCYISLFFWVLVNLFPSFHTYIQFLAKYLQTDPSVVDESIILYAYEPSDAVFNLIRNNGGFWEPGVYATWLLIALVLHTITFEKINKTWWIIFLTLLTTFSTAGFIGLAFVLLGIINRQKVSRKIKLQRKFLILTIITISLFNVSFLGDKVTYQLTNANSTSLNSDTSGRFLSARKAMVSLSRNPLFGERLILKLEVDNLSQDDAFGGYGLIDWLARIGIIPFFIYLYYLYKSITILLIKNHKSKKETLMYYLAILAVLFSQSMYDDLMVLMLIFSSFVFPIRYRIKKYF